MLFCTYYVPNAEIGKTHPGMIGYKTMAEFFSATAAATLVQKHWRGKLERTQWRRIEVATLVVQSVWRGRVVRQQRRRVDRWLNEQGY